MASWFVAIAALFIGIMALWIGVRNSMQTKALSKQIDHMASLASSFQDRFDGVELSLEAMLDELDQKGREMVHLIESAAASKKLHLIQPQDPVPAGLAPEDKKRLVRQLFHQGLDAPTIARRLGIGQGEVQLIIDLPET